MTARFSLQGQRMALVKHAHEATSPTANALIAARVCGRGAGKLNRGGSGSSRSLLKYLWEGRDVVGGEDGRGAETQRGAPARC